MKKKLLFLICCTCMSLLKAQIQPDWTLVPNEYIVIYKENHVQQTKNIELPYQYISLSENELENLRNDSTISLISNVYQVQNSKVALTNKLMILSSIPLEILLNETNVKPQVQNMDSICFGEHLKIYVVTLNTQNPLIEYEKVKQHPGCISVETDYLIQTPKQITQPSQERSINYPQWALQNDDYPAFDINIDWAWSVTKGEGIKVAVIDEGIDLDHQDLAANLLPGYDMTDGLYGGENGGYANNDNHGTLCAGIIAALDNDQGIVGVAPQAKIIPIRGGYDNPYDNTVEWYTYESIWLINALQKAFDEGADVINNSWGTPYPTTIMTDILDSLTQYGRNGKGIIIAYATGNENNYIINSPSWHPNVLAVGASTRNGRRLEESNYGNGIDIVAPGENIYSTTIQDSYLSDNGTSLACPHVAAVAALMLSVNPELTREEVHEIICSTAYKLPSYSYEPSNSEHPYGSWNREVGYGLIDASAAVFAAWSKQFAIIGPDTFCHSARYYIENVPAYADVQWIRTGIHDFDPDWVDLIDSTNFSLPVRKLRISNIWTDTINVQPGENIGFTPEGYYEPIPYSGFAELRPQVSYQNKFVRIEKEIYVEEQLDPGISAYISFFPELGEGSDNLLVGTPYYFKSALFPDEDELEWTIITAGDTITGIGRQTDTITARRDSIFVSVYNPNTDECLNTALCTKLFTTMEFIGMDFANPANEVVDIQVVHELPVDESQMYSLRARGMQALLYEGECEVELWDMYHGKLRSVSGTGGYVQMPLQGIASGNYVLRLIVNEKQVDSKPLMIR